MDEQQKACLAIILAFSVLNKRVSRKRKLWVKEWISKRRQYTLRKLLRSVLIFVFTSSTNHHISIFQRLVNSK